MSDVIMSIIIPVYNVKKYLRECLDSVVSQIDSEQFELILVDDGSEDGSSDICDEYASAFPKIVRVFHNSNHGLMFSRKFGVQNANGNYIMNCDSDDFLEPLAIKQIEECIIKTNCDVIIYNMNSYYKGNKTKLTSDIFFDRKSMEYVDKKEVLSEFISNTSIISMCCKAYKKQIVLDCVFDDYEYISNGEDTLQSIMIFDKANSFCYLNRELYNYRIQTGMTHRFDSNYFGNFSKAIELMINKKEKWSLPDFEQCISQKVYFTLGRAITQLRYGNYLSFKQMKSYLQELRANKLIIDYMVFYEDIKRKLPRNYQILNRLLFLRFDIIIIALLKIRSAINRN